MAANGFVILASHDGWRVGAMGADGPQVVGVSSNLDEPAQPLTQQLLAALEELGYTAGQPVVLAIPSPWCLCASIDTQELPRQGTESAMLYRLEENLPIAAEEIVADFISVQDQALGVCVQVSRIAGWLEAFDEAGLCVEVVCPTALLALQAWVAGPNHDQADLLVWGSQSHLDLFILDQDAKTMGWQMISPSGDDLAVQIGVQALGRVGPLRVAACDIGQPMQRRLEKLDGVDVVSCRTDPMHTLAVVAADEVLAGKSTPWINLRRGAVAVKDRLRRIRPALVGAIAAGVAFLLCLNGAMLWRANGYDKITTQALGQQRAVFQELFPSRPVPMSIKARLVSEQRRLRELHQGSDQMPTQRNGLLVLRDLLAHLPRDRRFRILELRLTGDQIHLAGQVRSHGDADVIAASLSGTDRFDFEPPRTENLSSRGVVGFTLVGTIQAGMPSLASGGRP